MVLAANVYCGRPLDAEKTRNCKPIPRYEHSIFRLLATHPIVFSNMIADVLPSKVRQIRGRRKYQIRSTIESIFGLDKYCKVDKVGLTFELN